MSFILLLAAGDAWAAEPPQSPILTAEFGAFKTLVNPTCSHCIDEAKKRGGELRDDDRVLAWIRGYSDGGAIPYRFFLNRYRVISDSYGVFVHDPDAGFARICPFLRFQLPRLAQRRHGHEAHGWHALFVPNGDRLRRPQEGRPPATGPDAGE